MKFRCLLVVWLLFPSLPVLAQNLVADPDTSTSLGDELDGTGGDKFMGTLNDLVSGANATGVSDGSKFDLGTGEPQWRVDLIGAGLVAGQQYTVTVNGVYSTVSKVSGDFDSLLVLNGPDAFALEGSTGTETTPGVFTGMFTAVANSSTITFSVNQSRASSFIWGFASMSVIGPPKVPELDFANSFLPLVSFLLLALITSGRKPASRE